MRVSRQERYNMCMKPSSFRITSLLLVHLLPVFALLPMALAAIEDPPVRAPADEILFRVNDLAINRSAVEMEFMAELGPDLQRIHAPGFPATERAKVLQKTWKNAAETVVNSAMVRSQSRDEWELVEQYAKAFPQEIREVTERFIREQLEARSGGAAEFEKQLKRFGVNRESLRGMLLERAAIQMYLDSKFRHVSQSTPDAQRAYYHAHPQEFAATGAVRLQRLAVKPGLFQALPAAELKTYIDDLTSTWQNARDPDAVAAALAARPAFDGAWTVLAPAIIEGGDAAAAEKADWLSFDRLPEGLKDAANLPVGRVLPSVTAQALRQAKAFGADGPAALRDSAPQDNALLIFRIAALQISPKPFEEVRHSIRDRLDHELLTKAKDEFFAQLRKDTLLTAPLGNPPPISPRFLTMDLSGQTPERAPVQAPKPLPEVVPAP